MRGNDAQRASGKLDIYNQCSARLPSRERNLAAGHHRSLANQQKVTAPAVTAVRAHRLDGTQTRVLFNRMQIKKARAISKTLIDLLQRNNVRADFLDDLCCSCSVERAIKSDTFVNIVGCDQDIASAFSTVDCGIGRAAPPQLESRKWIE